MKVYRFENARGLGPNCESVVSHETDEDHPGPVSDFKNGGIILRPDKLDWYFGCPSLEALYAWFSEDDRREMRDANMGFAVYVYTVPSRYVLKSKSGKQVAFNKKHSTGRMLDK